MYCFQGVSILIWNISEIPSNMHNFVNDIESSMAVLQGMKHCLKTAQLQYLSTVYQKVCNAT